MIKTCFTTEFSFKKKTTKSVFFISTYSIALEKFKKNYCSVLVPFKYIQKYSYNHKWYYPKKHCFGPPMKFI